MSEHKWMKEKYRWMNKQINEQNNENEKKQLNEQKQMNGQNNWMNNMHVMDKPIWMNKKHDERTTLVNEQKTWNAHKDDWTRKYE